MRALIVVVALLVCVGSTRTAARAALFLTCNFNVTSVSFGNYDPTAAAAMTAAGSVTITCILPTPITVSLSSGQANSFAPRAMTGPGSLPYNLFLPSGQVWGDGTGVTGTYPSTFTLLSAPVPIAGSIAPKQNAAMGSYSDSIIATATF